MKIAFCFSGQLRTGILASTNVIRYIGELLPNVTFFCHTWSINSYRPLASNPIKRSPAKVDPADFVRFKQIYLIPDIGFEVEQWTDEHDHLLDTTPWSPMYHSFSKSIELVNRTDVNYDLIIKYRPDLLLPQHRKLSRDILKTFSSVNFEIEHKIFAENTYPGGPMDDVYFFARPDIMNKFSGISDYIKQTGDYNVNNYLTKFNIDPHLIQGHGFIIYRDTCTHIDPLDWDECYRCNWRFYT